MAKTRRVGKSLIAINEQFGTEDQCLDYLEQARWLEGITCLKCGSTHISKFVTKETTRKRFDPKTNTEIEVPVPARRLYDCMTCGHQFSTTTGTLFHDTHLPLNKWFLAIGVLCNAKKSVSALQLQRDIQVSYRTAWYLGHRIREAMKQGVEGLFTGTVEMDETYLLGKFDKRRKRERWSREKPVFGIMERGGEVVAFHMEITKEDVFAKIKERVDPQAMHMTDDSNLYRSMRKGWTPAPDSEP